MRVHKLKSVFFFFHFNKWGPGLWSPHSTTAEQARPSARRFISVSLDKPGGHHSIGTHILLIGVKKKCYKMPDEAVLSFLHWKKKTGRLNEHELLLLLPFLALRMYICLDCFFFYIYFLASHLLPATGAEPDAVTPERSSGISINWLRCMRQQIH